ncbi:MAG: formyltetrahydrofolate deformylase [Phycisphaerae bacterium]|nr:formyltetrahydrofolate deformylase [Phycisphaerae bacterium]
MPTDATATLLVACPDREGVIAAVATALAEANRNILDADQHADPVDGRFFMRVAFQASATETDDQRAELAARIDRVATQLAMTTRLRWPAVRRRMAILCSKQTHCVADLLWRHSIGELDADVTRVISNHADAEPLADGFGHNYERLPITPETKLEQEARIVELLEADATDLVVLARYMQVLSPALVDRFAGRIINIHHSFLPAFAGAKPYHQAFEKGVKLIGATAHYVTADLDEGPIIAQQTRHVTHRDTVEDLVRKGRDLERVTLAEAVRLHLEDRVIVDGAKTIVFE